MWNRICDGTEMLIVVRTILSFYNPPQDLKINIIHHT